MLAAIIATLALATETPAPAPPMTLTVPALGGVTLVARDGGCDFTVVGTVPSRKAGEFAAALAAAKVQCLAAQDRAEAEVARAPAEADLIRSAGVAIATGQNARVVTPDGLEVAGGSHLEWQAYGEAVAGGSPSLFAPGVVPAGRDPNLFRLSGGAMGAFGSPAVPGQVAPAPASAECGTAAECQVKVKALSSALAEK